VVEEKHSLQKPITLVLSSMSTNSVIRCESS
jgi:hypothetical protein